jgi:hypothetical protein
MVQSAASGTRYGHASVTTIPHDEAARTCGLFKTGCNGIQIFPLK